MKSMSGYRNTCKHRLLRMTGGNDASRAQNIEYGQDSGQPLLSRRAGKGIHTRLVSDIVALQSWVILTFTDVDKIFFSFL